MKKFTAVILACICAVCSLAFSACDFGLGGTDNSGSDTGSEQVSELAAGKYKVTLVLNNGEQNKTVYAEKNKPVSTPNDPVKHNYLFVGWYEDAEFTTAYDFATAVTADKTLYARFTEATANGMEYVVTFFDGAR